MSTHASLPCASCGDGVTVHTDYLTPVTLCGACTPERWDGATLPMHTGVWTDADPAPYEEVDWPTLLASPCLLPIADDLGSYAHLSGHLGNLEMTSDAAAELRARVTGRAA